MKNPKTTKSNLRIGLVAPHMFLHREILPRVIFSPGQLALDLASGLQKLGAEVTLFSPGPVDTPVINCTADLSYFEAELAGRGDTYIDLLKKHPFTFVTLARQVQAELVASAFARANAGEFDLLHIYTNEEDIALPMAQLCHVPAVFTHHDPFNFLVKYKNVFPKYKHLNWISMSLAQRQGMPSDTNWAANIYHGLDAARFGPVAVPSADYIAYMGRIIQPKGLYVAIAAAKKAGLPLRIAGKHYAGKKDDYWSTQIEPQLSAGVEYVGFLSSDSQKREFLANAKALVVPSLFEEPFGMVSIEALACGTPVIALDSGALPEVVTSRTGIVVDGDNAVDGLAAAMKTVGSISRAACRDDFERRFTLERMCREHIVTYRRVLGLK